MDIKTASKRTLITIGIAAVWMLVLHGLIIRWAMTEPASIEHRLGETNNTTTNNRLNASSHSAGADQAATGTSQINSGSTGSVASQANPNLGWTHVTFLGILLISCVAMFAILVWAAVALNREEL